MRSKGLILLFSGIVLFGCAAKKTTDDKKKPLYEILTQQQTGGGNIRFYEILTEEKEIMMLQGDDYLKGKIKSDDVKNANFVILNMGEKHSGGYTIDVVKVDELPDKIVITVKDNEPEPGSMVTQAIAYPYTVVRINSKKPIEIK